MTDAISRRRFVGGSAALAGIAALGLGQVPAARADEAADTCDILVIGGGIAGALAALSVRLGVPAEEIPMPELRRLLEANRAIVP